jgi:flagella basal body P-ring formation protein FlgA
VVIRIFAILISFWLAFGYGQVSAIDEESSAGHAAEGVKHTGEEVKSLILKKAKASLVRRFSKGEYRFQVRPRWIPNTLLQQRTTEIQAVHLKGNVKRYTTFDVLYTLRGKRKKAQVQLKVKIERKVPVAVRRLPRDSKIEEEDLELQWVPVLEYQGKLVSDTAILKGKTLRRTLLAGQPVREKYVSRNYVIEAGDQVKVIIERAGIWVQVTGEARENGAKGDKIGIYSKETRRKYVGEVIRPGVTLWKNTL